MDTDAKQVDLKAKLDLDDGSDNGDWIVDGLTLAEDSKLAQEIMKNSNLPLADTSSSARKSFPSSFAIEFGFASKRNKERSEILTSRRRGATLAAAEAAKVSRSMRDFTPSSGGVMRRIRKAANAASGTSFFSNARLLGAYPGDAPSITDAGNASGLMNLATKYGYGEWSDSDRDDEFPWVGRTGSRRKKRRIKRPSYRSSKR